MKMEKTVCLGEQTCSKKGKESKTANQFEGDAETTKGNPKHA